MPATRRISTSPSPSRRQCNRSAMSRSFKTQSTVWKWRDFRSIARGSQAAGTAARSKNAVSRGRLSPAAIAATRSARASRGSAASAPSSASDRVRLQRPADAIERLRRAAPRQVVADDARREVVRDQVRSGNQREQARGDKRRRVRREPAAVMAPGVSQRVVEDPARRGGVEVRRIDQRRFRLRPERPQRALLRDRLSQGAESTDPSSASPHPADLRRRAARP